MSAITGKGGHLRKAIKDEFNVRDKAMSGDIVAVITPATVAQDAGAGAWTRTVIFELKTAAGELHDWLTASFATKVSIADTSDAGTASIASTTLSIVNGRAEIVVTGSNHAWVADETDTLTVASITVLGVATASKTSVGTFA